MSFDYETAWWEIARPAFDALPLDVFDILLKVALGCDDLAQEPCTLDMVWPDEVDGLEGFHAQFDNMPAEELAYAARVVYYFGHWKPGWVAARRALTRGGAHWKFSNYADQVLHRKLGLTLPSTFDTGIFFEIHEGVLRVFWSHRDGWQWEEVGWATQDNLERLRKIPKPLIEETFRICHARDEHYRRWEEYVVECKKALTDHRFENIVEASKRAGLYSPP